MSVTNQELPPLPLSTTIGSAINDIDQGFNPIYGHPGPYTNVNDIPVPEWAMRNEQTEPIASSIARVLSSVPGRIFTTRELLRYIYPAKTIELYGLANLNEQARQLRLLQRDVASAIGNDLMAMHLYGRGFLHQFAYGLGEGDLPEPSGRHWHRAVPRGQDYSEELDTVGDKKIYWLAPFDPELG